MGSDMKEGKSALILGIMGWVVAALSLVLNFATFRQIREDQIKREKAEPTFTHSIETYDPKILPKNFLILEEEAPHKFVVDHCSGKQVEGLTLQFYSPDKEIMRIEIVEGRPDTNVTISPGGHEATVKKVQLLERTSIKGYVYTKGIAAVKMIASASKGQVPMNGTATSDARRNTDWDMVFVLSFLAVFAIMVGVLLTGAYPRLRRSGIIASLRTDQDNVPLLVLLLVIMAFPDFLGIIPSIGEIMRAILLYLFLTRYRQIVVATKAIAAWLKTVTDALPESQKGSADNRSAHGK